MRNFNALLLALALCFSASACTSATLAEMIEEVPENSGAGSGGDTQSEEVMTVHISAGGKVFRADIEASETGRAFLAKLPLTLDMSELNGNEKYSYSISLPRADKHFDTLAAGDLMLYSGNCIVLFYGPAGGYRYTRIGRLRSTEGLAAALGSGSVLVTFEKE